MGKHEGERREEKKERRVWKDKGKAGESSAGKSNPSPGCGFLGEAATALGLMGTPSDSI